MDVIKDILQGFICQDSEDRFDKQITNNLILYFPGREELPYHVRIQVKFVDFQYICQTYIFRQCAASIHDPNVCTNTILARRPLEKISATRRWL